MVAVLATFYYGKFLIIMIQFSKFEEEIILIVKILVLKHYKYMQDKNLMLQLRQQGYHYTYQMHLHLMMQIKQLEFLH